MSFTDKTDSSSNLGLIFVSITGGIAAAITLITVPFVTPAFRKFCLPYVPATTSQVSNVITALKGRSGNLVDLGSGDGRIVAAAASNGFNAVGVELNYFLVLYSRISSLFKGNVYIKRTKFVRANLWSFPLRSYSNIVIFGTEQMMNQLENKLKNEAGSDCVVVACRYPLPSLKANVIIGEGIDTVWRYDLMKKTMT